MDTTKATCKHCAEPLHWAARSDARFCSTRCRVANHRKRHLPRPLTDAPRWVRHDNKRPITLTGRAASSTNPETWSPYLEARDSSVGDGLGFVLNGDGIVCIDLDHCIQEGTLAPWAESILTTMPDTYVEVSPSGTGLHIWGYADIPRSRIVGHAEIYRDGRYLTITGKPYRKAPAELANIQEGVNALLL